MVQYLEQNRQSHQILIDESDGWRDPDRVISRVLHVDPISFCEVVNDVISSYLVTWPGRDVLPRSGEWTRDWIRLGAIATQYVTETIDEFDTMFEGRIFPELLKLLPEESIVFAGNGMPVRDMDTFMSGDRGYVVFEDGKRERSGIDTKTRFLSNRGASGIDGVISSALGASAGSGKRTVLVIGDISFFHDMNGLLAAKAHSPDCTIIVVNNDGGGIFSFLPQYAYDDIFEPLFGTPHGLTFRAAADLYGLEYFLVNNWEEFGDAVEKSFATPGTTVVEVPGDRESNVTMHRMVWERVSMGIQSVIAPYGSIDLEGLFD